MSENSDVNINEKNKENNLDLKLHSLDSSSSSRNEEDILFSSNCILSKYDFGSKTTVTTRSFQNLNNKELCDSEDIYIKKRNKIGSGSSPIQKHEIKKSTDVLSTEPGYIKVKNYTSPKKKYSVFKLVEKDKKTKKEFSNIIPNNIFTNDKKAEDEKTPSKKERYDIYGNLINKKNKKKIKVSFIDKVTHQPLCNIIDIESFRNYNYNEGIPKEEKMKNVSTNCQCCLIY
jgi:hypothetical protein